MERDSHKVTRPAPMNVPRKPATRDPMTGTGVPTITPTRPPRIAPQKAHLDAP